MSDRHKPHNGRDKSGHFKVRQVDLDELRTEPNGEEYIRDDVRLGGAVEDVGTYGHTHGKKVEELIEKNRDETKSE